METLFQWSSDVQGNGALAARYVTGYWLPNVEEPDGGRRVRAAAVETLDGETLVLRQGRAGASDGRAPGRFTLKWEVADPVFLRLAEEDYAKGRLVEVRLDHRWRQLRVTGGAGRTVTVAAGYLFHAGDTYWLTEDTVHVCSADATRVFAVPANGVLTIGSGTAVPAGAVLLTEVSVEGDVVAVLSAPSGVPNGRQGYVIGWHTTQVSGGLTGVEVVVQEVR